MEGSGGGRVVSVIHPHVKTLTFGKPMRQCVERIIPSGGGATRFDIVIRVIVGACLREQTDISSAGEHSVRAGCSFYACEM